jgi:hypothetical protein
MNTGFLFYISGAVLYMRVHLKNTFVVVNKKRTLMLLYVATRLVASTVDKLSLLLALNS